MRALAPLTALACLALSAMGDPSPAPELNCTGAAKQSGLLICEGPADTDIGVAGPDGENARMVHTDADGHVLIGLHQKETSQLILTPQAPDATPLHVEIAPRKDDFRLIKGFNCDKVDARTEAQKQHAADSWVKKQAAFKTFNDGPATSEGFVRPVTGPASSPFGPTRKYVGTGGDGKPCEKVSVHEGFDYAVATGTPVIAPAGGTVVLADSDLYYEGGTVFLDHGGGLVSVFLHLSDVSVEAGDTVDQGERLGASGNTGRTTGPHLHWAVKWRNPANEDRGEDFYIDPAILRALEP
ncbi:M23 family metallopeptidase [Henriciella aquimarina]|uniref:M23 family metallopeptidase n=1 Tax=Henriciella aquimarina TaxID=545261 RepID=UPI001F2847E6|nr:M23 family metallopeptidase [Henriciella aquimarina]